MPYSINSKICQWQRFIHHGSAVTQWNTAQILINFWMIGSTTASPLNAAKQFSQFAFAALEPQINLHKSQAWIRTNQNLIAISWIKESLQAEMIILVATCCTRVLLITYEECTQGSTNGKYAIPASYVANSQCTDPRRFTSQQTGRKWLRKFILITTLFIPYSVVGNFRMKCSNSTIYFNKVLRRNSPQSFKILSNLVIQVNQLEI